MNITKPLQSRSYLLLTFLVFLGLSSCSEKEELVSEDINEFYPVQTGKYITYRVDSTVFTSFGSVVEVHKYQMKHQVDVIVPDNQGRPAYRVYYYLRDSAGLQAWQPKGSYTVTVLPDQVETSEDNMRIIKLHMPLKDGFTWQGNHFLPDQPYLTMFDFTNDDFMDDWDFYYDGNPASFSFRGRNYENVLTVEQVDEAFNVPITNPASFASRSRSVEKYAKGIGLVYRELELWDYQPNPSGAPFRRGFGITMWMIDHN